MHKRRGTAILQMAIGAITLASAHMALASDVPGDIARTARLSSAVDVTLVPAVLTTSDAPAITPASVDPLPDAPTPATVATVAEPSPDAAQIECVAKVIVHEAGNQPIEGQRAVAQVIRTRIKDGRFGADACGVVKQRGQFFDVDAYQPSQSDARWKTATAIATATLKGEGEEVAAGALFFHTASAAMPRRVRVAQIADHVFYR